MCEDDREKHRGGLNGKFDAVAKEMCYSQLIVRPDEEVGGEKSFVAHSALEFDRWVCGRKYMGWFRPSNVSQSEIGTCPHKEESQSIDHALVQEIWSTLSLMERFSR